MSFSYRLFAIITAMVSLFSCKPSRTLQDVTLLNKVRDSSFAKVAAFEPAIQIGDKLAITVTGLEANSAAQFNQTPAQAGSTPGGYIVSPDGTINFPQLGRLKVEGMTRTTLERMLTDTLVKYVMNPVVSVQFINFKVTVLGEVNRPGPIPLSEGKINMLEAIGLSGDLTIYAKRKNILVIREKDGKRELGRVDLTSSDLFSSPYYHLQQNDIVYVEMIDQKLTATNQGFIRGNLSLIASAIGILLSIIVLVIRLK